ncbi:hypothetical protein JW911_03370 [Candidatus Peregrinibacteria bacterium]|nr:hypothetical protein [Candidatus Peregrinibacteria bacterium]
MHKNKTKTKSIFFEHRLVCYKRKEDELYEEGTPVEKGNLEPESILKGFHERYNPWNLNAAINNPDEVIFGVRDRMMDPLGGINQLSGDNILNTRVSYKLEHIATMAPQAYKQIIDEEVRRRGGPGPDYTWSNARKKIERQVAADFFTYDIFAGQNYMTLRTNLQAQIQGLGFIGNRGFTDSRRNRINLANPFATNEFDVATGAPGMPAQETVVIKWHQEDFITIKNKLERAGLWSDFSSQPNARRFIHLKFRHSLLERTVAEEAAKLSNDKYNPQRLITWLENDLTRQALREDTIFEKWVKNKLYDNTTTPPTVLFSSVEDLKRRNPNLYRELIIEQNKARVRTRPNSLYNHLTTILLPKSLENVQKSKETKTLLAYLFHKSNDPDDASDVYKYMGSLAGSKVDTTKDEETLNSLTDPINLFNEFQENFINDFGELSDLKKEFDDIHTEITGIGAKSAGEQAKLVEKVKELNAREREIKKSMNTIQNKLIKNIKSLKTLITENLTANGIFGMDIDLKHSDWNFLDFTFLSNPRFDDRPSDYNDKKTYIDDFTRLCFNNPDIIKNINNLSNSLNTNKKNIEDRLKDAKEKNEKAEAAEKMDSRGLLYLLVKRDLERKGLTAETGLHEKAHLTTNLLIADCRNAEIYGNVNQHIASGLEKSFGKRLKEAFQSGFFFSPTLSGQDAIAHIIDLHPELAMFKDINLFSTRKDLIQMMHRYGMANPAKIREFIAMIGECIRGIELPGEGAKEALKTKIKVFDQDVPHLERLINMLTLLETQLRTENFLQGVREAEAGEPALDRQKLILNMLKDQTEGENALDERLANSLQGHDARFKRLFMKKDLKAEYNMAMDQLGALPADLREQELIQRGLAPRVATRGVVSLRAERGLKKAGIAILKYNPISLVGWGMGWLGEKGGRWAWNYMKGKWNVIKPEMQAGRAVWKAKTEGAIMRVPLYAAAIPVGITAWGLSAPSRFLKWLLPKSATQGAAAAK